MAEVRQKDMHFDGVLLYAYFKTFPVNSFWAIISGL